MRNKLNEIVEHGSPAHALMAQELLIRDTQSPGDAEVQQAAQALFEAHLHDPYLTRNPHD